jgi:hypothetical protein
MKTIKVEDLSDAHLKFWFARAIGLGAARLNEHYSREPRLSLNGVDQAIFDRVIEDYMRDVITKRIGHEVLKIERTTTTHEMMYIHTKLEVK